MSVVPPLQKVNRELHVLPPQILEQIGTDEDRGKFGNGYVFSRGGNKEGDETFVNKGVDHEKTSTGYNQGEFRAQGSQRILSINAGHGRRMEDLPRRVFPAERDVPDFFPQAQRF